MKMTKSVKPVVKSGCLNMEEECEEEDDSLDEVSVSGHTRAHRRALGIKFCLLSITEMFLNSL